MESKCKHKFRNRAFIGDVVVLVVSECIHCGYMTSDKITRSYQSYCRTEKSPSKGKYRLRLAEEGLEEPKKP